MELLIFTISHQNGLCIVSAKGTEGCGEDLDEALQNWLDQRLYIGGADDDQDAPEA